MAWPSADPHAFVLDALAASMSDSADVRKPAEEALGQCQRSPGFLQILVQIISEPQHHENLRLGASISLKLTVQNHWKPRRGDVYNLSLEEKEALKRFLLEYTQEADDKVAAQLSETTARAARIEWPGSWPTLFEALVNSIHQGDPLGTQRAVFTLHRVMKELSTKRLMRDKTAFAAVCVQLFPIARQLWQQRIEQLVGCLGQWVHASGDELATLEAQLLPLAKLTTYLTKILFRVVCRGFPRSLQQDAEGIPAAELSECFRVLLDAETEILGAIAAWVARGGPVPGEVDVSLPTQLGKLLYRLTAIPLEAQKDFPLPFRPFLLPFLERFHAQVLRLFPAPPQEGGQYPATPGTNPRGLERLGVNLILFLGQVVGCSEYRMDMLAQHTTSASRSDKGAQESTSQAVQEAAFAVEQFFTPERVQELFHLTISALFPLTPADIEEWTSDSEQYVLDQESITSKECPRAAGENLLLSLLEARQDLLCPVLLELLSDTEGQQAAAAQEAQTLARGGASVAPEVLTWEARYLAAGVCAYALQGRLDFTVWFMNCLAPALDALVATARDPAPLGGDDPAPPVLLRRIIWLIGPWLHELNEEVRPQLYTSLVALLFDSRLCSEQEKAVVLTLQSTLHGLVDNWSFAPAAFASVTGDAVNGLYRVCFILSNFESRLQILSLIHLILERVGSAGILPHVESIMQPLPQIWESTADQNLLRKSVLNITTLVVSSLGSQASHLFGFVLPMLSLATDPTRPDTEYLLEDGLELWLSVMQQTPSYTEPLHNLFPHVQRMLERDMEFVKQAMALTEAYIAMGGAQFLETHVQAVVQAFSLTVGEVKPKAVVFVTQAIETLLRRFPADGAAMLREGGILGKLLEPCLSTEASAANGMTLHLAVLARVMFTAPEQMQAFLSAPPISDGSADQVLGRVLQLVDLWLGNFDTLGAISSAGSWHRKLVTLALVSLMPASPGMFSRLDQVLDKCIDVLSEIETSGGDAAFTLLGSPVRAKAPGVPDAPDFYTQCQRGMVQSDPVLTTNLRGFLEQKMAEAEAAVGSENFQQAMAAVDPALLAQLQQRRGP